MASIIISTTITIDNENSAGTGLPDNDVGIVGNWRHVNNTDVEFTLPVSSANLPNIQAASLEIVALDVDSTEQDGVWFNGQQLANLTTGADQAVVTSLYNVKAYLAQSNLIQIGNINPTQDALDPWTFAINSAKLTIRVTESTFNDGVGGTARDDSLLGDGDNNKFLSTGGHDSFNGGGGELDSVSYASSFQPVVVTVLAAGPSTVFVGGVAKDTIANIEVVLGGLGSDVIAAPFVDGFFGDDILRGTTATNFLSGSQGNDTVDYRDKTLSVVAMLPPGRQGSVLIGGTANVTVGTQHDFLGGIENVLGGSAGDNLTGNDVDNKLSGFGGNDVLNGDKASDTLDGGIGNDFLDGGLDADRMRGGAGNDTYVVDNAGDVVDEAAAGSSGSDLVRSSLSFNLGDANHAKGGVDNLTLIGGAAITATGNSLSNILTGNAAANTLDGGPGNDILAGGAGNDQFLFDTKPNKTNNADHITDFVHKTDIILLDESVFKKLDAGKLHKSEFFSGNGLKQAHDDDDRVVYDTKSGKLYYDKDGEGGHGATLFAILDGSPSHISAKDFLIVT